MMWVYTGQHLSRRRGEFGNDRNNADETEPVHGPLPSPSAQAHLAVDAIEVLLDASNGALEHLEILEPYMIPKMHYTPDDTYYGSQQSDFQATNTDDAWDITAGSPDITVQVIDTGLFGSSGKGDHPDLQKNIWQNPGETNCTDGVDDDDNGYIDDCHGYNFADDSTSLEGSGDHGTHCAGTVAADSDNSIGVAGTAGGKGGSRGASLMIGVLFGVEATEGSEEALVYGADNGANISSNSWGYAIAGYEPESVLEAIDYAIEAGVFVVFAAGNDVRIDNEIMCVTHDSAFLHPSSHQPMHA